MKKLIAFSSALLLTLAMLTSCAGTGDTTTQTGGETSATVVTTTEHKPVVYPETIDFGKTDEIVNIFWMDDLLPGVTTTVSAKRSLIIQKCTINGVDFAFRINLEKWAGRTTPEQIVQCARTFWYCYPQMYFRFHVDSTPKSVVLKIENEGYEVASTSGSEVHIHDGWLEGNKTDYDCLTHEFAHVVQSGWDGNYVPSDGDDTYMIERFADYCRFVYSYVDGYYNDVVWTLQTSSTENSYAKGVRFWVWVDYTYSTGEIDIMQRLQRSVLQKNNTVARKNWASDGSAWGPVFEGTGAAGKTLDQLWAEYTASDMAALSSNSGRRGKTSPLLMKHPIRKTIKGRQDGSDDYLLQ